MRTPMMIAAAALALGTAAAQAQQVRVGIAAEPYPPFASPDAGGNWVGWEIEIIGAVCEAAEMDCVITPVAWDGIIPSLTSQQIDAIMASMSITEERMQTIDFSDKYYNTPAVVVAPRDMDIEATAEGLAGRILGVQVATTHAAYAQEHFAASVAELRSYQTQDEANQDLVAGRIDATQADSLAMADFLESDAGQCCEIKGSVPADPSILGRGVGVGLRKGDDALRERFNAGIAAIIADGTYDAISANYFTTSIYGD